MLETHTCNPASLLGANYLAATPYMHSTYIRATVNNAEQFRPGTNESGSTNVVERSCGSACDGISLAYVSNYIYIYIY